MTRSLILSAACIALLAAAPRVEAHSWYEPRCCNTQDCAPLPAGSVRFDASTEEWVVTLAAGDHFKVHAPMTLRIRKGDPKLRASQDADFHGCILGGRLICLYLPTGGV